MVDPFDIVALHDELYVAAKMNVLVFSQNSNAYLRHFAVEGSAFWGESCYAVHFSLSRNFVRKLICWPFPFSRNFVRKLIAGPPVREGHRTGP